MRVAVVTGANRGIGFETCRQLGKQGIQVVLTSRDRAKGEAATEKLQLEGLEVVYYNLDVVDPVSVAKLGDFIDKRFERLDILVNNAGVLLDDRANSSILQAKTSIIRQTMETNVYGALNLCQVLVPLMQEHDYGRIVNVSSGMGQLSDMNGGYTAYRISKTSLNALTCILADEMKGTNILVNSACPGWVKTDMGGEGATRSPEQGADTIAWLATLPDGSPSGGFWRDRQPMAW